MVNLPVPVIFSNVIFPPAVLETLIEKGTPGSLAVIVNTPAPLLFIVTKAFNPASPVIAAAKLLAALIWS